MLDPDFRYDGNVLELCEIIISNPAEIPIHPDLIKDLPEYQLIKEKFGNLESEPESFDVRIKQLQCIQGIQRQIILDEGKEPPNVLIVGAGPAGLLRAVLSTLAGCNVTVLEKRPEKHDGRPNVLVLGKSEKEKQKISDLTILRNLGITMNIERKLGTFKPMNSQPIEWTTVQIDHLRGLDLLLRFDPHAFTTEEFDLLKIIFEKKEILDNPGFSMKESFFYTDQELELINKCKMRADEILRSTPLSDLPKGEKRESIQRLSKALDLLITPKAIK